MIFLKNPQEIEIMAIGGRKLNQVLEKGLEKLKPGITTAEIDQVCEKEITVLGGKPSFKMVPGYHWATCITVNEEVVHGIPGNRLIREGDVVGIDVGIFYHGFHTDMAKTVLVPRKNSTAEEKLKQRFLSVGERTLDKAINQVKAGNYLGQISKTIEEEIGNAGYSVVRELTGHGVGRKLHEEPAIPGFLDREIAQTERIVEGMVLAIEVIYNLGKPEVVLNTDGWTIVTKDAKISALFEHTVAVTANGSLILTKN
jgi:methionyl aminopeptidase